MKRTRDRVAIYVRASTLEQDLAGQRKDLLDEARRRGWKVNGIYSEAKSSRVCRPQLDKMHAAAMQRIHDTILIWRLDRLGRSVLEVLGRVNELRDRGVAVVSVRDGAIDTTTAAGQFRLATLAAAAEFERELLRERTLEGLARARAEGKTLGRPRRRDTANLERAAASVIHLHEGLRETARTHEIPLTTLRRYIAECRRRAKKGVSKIRASAERPAAHHRWVS